MIWLKMCDVLVVLKMKYEVLELLYVGCVL